MSVLTEKDRHFLRRLCDLAEAAKQPPKKLGLRPEPLWAALLADQNGELASATFSSGDKKDAVKLLLEKIGREASSQALETLYLTLEPKAGFDRLPPVTESIRKLGVKRVVLGTLDPAQRFRGEGSRTLERMGVEVVLADGEEARRSQQLIEDYSKWLQKGVAVLRAQVEMRSGLEGGYQLSFSRSSQPSPRADAYLCRSGLLNSSSSAWRVVLDLDAWERAQEKTILYQPEDCLQTPGARMLPMRNGQPDLGALLRDLASLGLLSIELCADAELFRLALAFGLLESVTARFPEEEDTMRALSHSGKVHLMEGGDPVELRLGGAKILDGQSQCLEGRLELFSH